MNDEDFARELVSRLNALCEDKNVKKLVNSMFIPRYSAPELKHHPTIQWADGGVSLLGLLNGIVGVIPDGVKKDWGYITAHCKEDDDESILYFSVTERE